MKQLTNKQLQSITGQGWLSCSIGIAAFGLAAASLILATGGGAAPVVAAVAYSIAPAGAALSCLLGGVQISYGEM
jgi:bacteriocin-like protein